MIGVCISILGLMLLSASIVRTTNRVIVSVAAFGIFFGYLGIFSMLMGFEAAFRRQTEFGPLAPTPPSLMTDDARLSPVDYHGDVRAAVTFVQPDEVVRLCDQGPTVVACQAGAQIIAPNPCLYVEEYYAGVLCHEVGHMNGWRHPQPGRD